MNKITVLYAEDETDIRKNNINFIKSEYHIDVIEASDGEEAWELYVKHKPEILITDIVMPKLSGLELVSKIRENDEQIPVIVLSAYSEQEKLLQAIELNLISYQMKPLNRKKLHSSLQKAIAKSRGDIKTNEICLLNLEKDSYNFETKELFVKNKEIKLTKNELVILELFLKNRNIILDTHSIFNALWELERDYNANSLRLMLKRLRKKLPENLLVSIYGKGYKFVG